MQKYKMQITKQEIPGIIIITYQADICNNKKKLFVFHNIDILHYCDKCRR